MAAPTGKGIGSPAAKAATGTAVASQRIETGIRGVCGSAAVNSVVRI